MVFKSHVFFSSSSFSDRGVTELGDITPHNIKQLKILNSVVFPVSYNDKFYKDVLEVGELAKLGLYLNRSTPDYSSAREFIYPSIFFFL